LMIVILNAVNQLGKANVYVDKVIVAFACINFLFVLAGLHNKQHDEQQQNCRLRKTRSASRKGKIHVGEHK